MQISKTNFITYLDCSKNAWLKIHKPDIYKQYPISSFERNIIDTGNEIDLLARNLFPGGVAVSSRDDVEYTRKLLGQKTPVIYQPVFTTDTFITASDIFVWNPKKNLYDLYEVKASTSAEEGGSRKIKDYLIDMAFQRIVLDGAGITIGSTNLIRLNKEYVRNGPLVFDKLFIIENLTAEVNEIIPEVAQKMEAAYHYLSRETEPPGFCDCILKGANAHCTTSPYSNADLPEYPVHEIARIHKTKLAMLVDNGVLSIYDVPPDFPLSPNQRRQVDTAQSGKPYIDRKNIAAFLETLEYPLSFLDYETYPSAIPRYDGYSPYQQIPFQFSLLIIKSPDSPPAHHEFIYTEQGCPDEAFTDALQKYLPNTGNIVVWNQKFEKGINEQIGRRLPRAKTFLEDVNIRVIDLMIPFSGNSLAYDHPKFKGSASIKYVLPALVPHLSYKEMHIQEGGTASDTWNRIVSGEYSDEEAKMKTKALLDYCHLDTLAMVEIWRVLMSI
jgi:hypothetical protein